MTEPASPRPSTAMTSVRPSRVTMHGAGRLGLVRAPGLPGRRAPRRRPGRAGLPEVVADELALLGQQLVEVLVDVRVADRLRGQVQILDLLELTRAVVRRLRGRVARHGACWRLVRVCAVRGGGPGGIG